MPIAFHPKPHKPIMWIISGMATKGRSGPTIVDGQWLVQQGTDQSA